MSLKSKTILILDDDTDMLRLLDRILTGAGFTVLQAQSPNEARDLLYKNAPHIILTDLNMEPENGFKFIQSIKSQKKFSTVPILVLSALKDFQSVKKAIGLGVNDYVLKPLQAPMLLRKIRKVMLNKDFVKWDTNQKMDLSFEGEITSLGETGFFLKVPIKTTPGKSLKVSVPEFRTIGIDQFHQQINQSHKTYSSGGTFYNDISFVAITEKAASSIRQYLLKNNKI